MINSSTVSNQDYLISKAYATEDHLSIRIQTHELYSQPQQDFTAWVLDLIPWKGNEIVLDAGCGAGLYIQPIRKRLTNRGKIISADLSFGMLSDVAKKESASSSNLLNTNIMRLPIPDASCDILLANHVLYHVPDIQAALKEIKRVLQPGGYLIAATNAKDSMMKIIEQIEIAYQTLGDPIQIPPTPPRASFSLENGVAFFEIEFCDFIVHRLESHLVFPDAKPVIAYTNSMRSFYEPQISTSISWEAMLAEMEIQITREIKQNGEYRVAKTTGAFVAKNIG